MEGGQPSGAVAGAGRAIAWPPPNMLKNPIKRLWALIGLAGHVWRARQPNLAPITLIWVPEQPAGARRPRLERRGGPQARGGPRAPRRATA